MPQPRGRFHSDFSPQTGPDRRRRVWRFDYLNGLSVAPTMGRSEPVGVDVIKPCKHADDSRTYLCLYCKKLCFVCRYCERGQIYCGPLCRDAGRRKSLARARRIYRNSDRGRQMASLRQARHRERRAKKTAGAAQVAAQSPVHMRSGLSISPVQVQGGTPETSVAKLGADALPTDVSTVIVAGSISPSRKSHRPLGHECTLCHRPTSGFQRGRFLWDCYPPRTSWSHMNKWDRDP